MDKKYALKLGEDGRILYATFSRFAHQNAVYVDELPEGNVMDYRYEDENYIYDPIVVEAVETPPSQLDIIEAQVTYTAMMTDTLLEV